MGQLPRIVKDMMQVPLHLVGGRSRQVRTPGGGEVLQCTPGPCVVGAWDLEMAGVEGGAGLGKRQPETGTSDPDPARPRGATRLKIISVQTTQFLLGSLHLGAQWPWSPPSSFWHWVVRSLLPDSAPRLAVYVLFSHCSLPQPAFLPPRRIPG